MDFTRENKKATHSQGLVFNKVNFGIMLAGVALLVLGFVVMSLETAEYGFGPSGLTVGPILLLLGFLVQFVAILYKRKED
jgi:hypothetical protein